MAGFMVTSTLLMAVGLGLAANVVLSDTAKGAHLVRRELKDVREAEFAQPVDVHHRHGRMKNPDQCNDNYLPGTEGGIRCTDSTHLDIKNKAKCEEAARESCPDDDGDGVYTCVGDEDSDPSVPFEIPKLNQRQRYYPKYCFKTEDGKFHWNGFGGTPDKLEQDGTPKCTPICKRKEYAEGTVAADGTASCPAGYTVIDHEDACDTASRCEGEREERVFRVLNNTNNQHTPLGCHINQDDDLVQFNPFSTFAGTAGAVNATPICNLTHTRGDYAAPA
jgi:hypothetical protein